MPLATPVLSADSTLTRSSALAEPVALDAPTRSLRHADEVAAAIVLVDVKNEQAREFYARYGFVEVGQTTNRMFLPMKTVEQLLKSST